MKSGNKIQFNIDDIKATLVKIFSDRRRLGRTILILLILIIALVIRLSNINRSGNQIDVSEVTQGEMLTSEMYVDISGEVNKPGVYIVEDGTRLYEVIEKAGGLTDKANTVQINQAGYVEDGEKIIIPSISDGNTELNISDISGTSTKQASSTNGLININTASKDQLMSITGVGEVIADRIIEYRKSKKFKSIEDIMNVKGIGNATYEKMKSEICV